MSFCLVSGKWLEVNGAGLFDTRPWVQAEGRTTQGAPVRFTAGDGSVYADNPGGNLKAVKSSSKSIRAGADTDMSPAGL